ncbi:hypothetical protein GCM10027417_31780 [Glutamicibacter endophyticus]
MASDLQLRSDCNAQTLVPADMVCVRLFSGNAWLIYPALYREPEDGRYLPGLSLNDM